MPGVVAAGWTSGSVEMDRTIRFAAADWRDGDKVNKDKIAAAMSGVLSRDACRQAVGRGLERQYRKAEADASSGRARSIRRSRLTETHRDHRAGISRTSRAHPTG